MLKQILKDMYVDPEILAELPEEQKQILFFKIREEQKRRYYEQEKENEKKGVKLKKLNKKKQTKSPPKRVSILEDSNGQPWTWIMGEHPNDIPIEEIWANLGNKDWKPMKMRENQPVSKVQAIIFAQNKNQTDVPDTANQRNTVTEKHPDVTKSGASRVTTVKTDNSKVKAIDSIKLPKVVAVTHDTASAQKLEKESTSRPIQHLTPLKNSSSAETSPVPSPSTTRRIIPNSTKSESVPSRTGNKGKPNKGKSSEGDSDSDPYENMSELTDTLPNKELGENEWKTQLKRFKEADKRRSLHARRASMQIKRLSQQNLLNEKKVNDLKARFERKRSVRDMKSPGKGPSLPPKPKGLRPKHPISVPGRDTKPSSGKEAEDWFKETQCAEILESLNDENKIPDWFHGLISRSEAEQLLEDRKVGDFLIRASDKIWGYALSFRDENKIKHFLIDGSEPNCYHFFGNDQIRHPGLEQLIAFHKEEPISYGNEILKQEVGQKDPNNPDYSKLIAGTNIAEQLTAIPEITKF